MTDDEEQLEPLPVEVVALQNKLHSLESLDVAIHNELAGGNEAAARQLAQIARQHALAALQAALECVALPLSERARFSPDAVRHAERLLNIQSGTFSSSFAVNFRDNPEKKKKKKKKALADLLVEVRDDLANAPADKPLRETLSWLPAIIRISSAVLVGAAVGAPLAALAVGEPVVTEIVKAGIAVTACALAAEVTNHALDRWLHSPTPGEQPHLRLVGNEPGEPRGALPEPVQPEPDDLPGRDPDVDELIRQGLVLLEQADELLGHRPAQPEVDPVEDRMHLELATPDVGEPAPPAPPPAPPPKRLDSPFDDPFEL